MTDALRTAPNDKRQAAMQVVESLPAPNYSVNYQPTYPDQQGLLEAVYELHCTAPVTHPRQVDALRLAFSGIAEHRTGTPIVFLGNCLEEVDLAMPIDVLVKRAADSLGIIANSALGAAIKILRNRGQNAKPRTNEFEELANGRLVVSFMGDSINGRAIRDRTPDPRRMVAAAVQARDIESGLEEQFGYHVPAAHEALLLPHEKSFIRRDPETGKKYLLSTDVPWIGFRTNAPEGEHVAMLAGVENPVPVKLGPSNTPEQVASLIEILNPNREPGKLLFMPRFGLDNAGALWSIIQAIRRHAPESLIVYDMHGSTRTLPDGTKIRLVSDISDEIKAVADQCEAAGLRLNGVHLETMTDDTRLECVDEPDQKPTHPGNLDPQLNPRQTRQVLDAAAPFLL